MSKTPRILFIGGHDPVGGAGIQADIETAAAHGCRAFTLITCLTTQDSRDVHGLHPQDPSRFETQLRCLLADVSPDLVKVGLIGDARIALLLGEWLRGLPLVLDPVLAAGGGTPLADMDLPAAIRRALLPRTTLLTPNRSEARHLAGCDDSTRATAELLRHGCRLVLLTGADECGTDTVTHYLEGDAGHHEFQQPRLPGHYHGSGCTLAAACACNLARGMDIRSAVQGALDWTWQSLRHAESPGHGQHLPNRRMPLP